MSPPVRGAGWLTRMAIGSLGGAGAVAWFISSSSDAVIYQVRS